MDKHYLNILAKDITRCVCSDVFHVPYKLEMYRMPKFRDRRMRMHMRISVHEDPPKRMHMQISKDGDPRMRMQMRISVQEDPRMQMRMRIFGIL